MRKGFTLFEITILAIIVSISIIAVYPLYKKEQRMKVEGGKTVEIVCPGTVTDTISNVFSFHYTPSQLRIVRRDEDLRFPNVCVIRKLDNMVRFQ